MIRDQRFQGTRIIWFVSIELYEFNIRCKQGWAGNIFILYDIVFMSKSNYSSYELLFFKG